MYGVKKQKKLKSVVKKNKVKQRSQINKKAKGQLNRSKRMKNSHTIEYIYFSGRNSYLDKRYNRDKGNV